MLSSQCSSKFRHEPVTFISLKINALLLMVKILSSTAQFYTSETSEYLIKPQYRRNYNSEVTSFPDHRGYHQNYYQLLPSIPTNAFFKRDSDESVTFTTGGLVATNANSADMGETTGRHMNLEGTTFATRKIVPTTADSQQYTDLLANDNVNIVEHGSSDEEVQHERGNLYINSSNYGNTNGEDSVTFGSTYNYGRVEENNAKNLADFKYYEDKDYSSFQGTDTAAFRGHFEFGDNQKENLIHKNQQNQQAEDDTPKILSMGNLVRYANLQKKQKINAPKILSNQLEPETLHSYLQVSERPSYIEDSRLQYSHPLHEDQISIELRRLQDLHNQLQLEQTKFIGIQQKFIQQNLPLDATKQSVSLPSATTTVHHTPDSTKALAGIPLAKHVEIRKTVPVTNYHQQLVPYKQTVPVPVPRAIITAMPRPMPIKVPISKTIAVPQVQDLKIPIEKVKPFVVERRVPYIVERRVPFHVEKAIATPHFYPYPIKVPIVRTVVHKLPSHHHQYVLSNSATTH